MSPTILAESVRLALSNFAHAMHRPPARIQSSPDAAAALAPGKGRMPTAASPGKGRRRPRWSAQITPLDGSSSLEKGRQVEVTSIDERGVAFVHEAPLTARRVLLTPDDPASGIPVAVLDLTWCRFSPGGAYSSGGRYERAHRRPA